MEVVDDDEVEVKREVLLAFEEPRFGGAISFQLEEVVGLVVVGENGQSE